MSTAMTTFFLTTTSSCSFRTRVARSMSPWRSFSSTSSTKRTRSRGSWVRNSKADVKTVYATAEKFHPISRKLKCICFCRCFSKLYFGFLIGPGCSETAEPIAGVSKHFHTVVISYSAEALQLTNRVQYPLFFRTIPHIVQSGSISVTLHPIYFD